jgi:hypothetical protein
VSAATRLVARLEEAGFRPAANGRPRWGRAWMAVCPACVSLGEPSLGIGELDATGPLGEGLRLHCWAGCEPQAVEAALARLDIVVVEQLWRDPGRKLPPLSVPILLRRIF